MIGICLNRSIMKVLSLTLIISALLLLMWGCEGVMHSGSLSFEKADQMNHPVEVELSGGSNPSRVNTDITIGVK